jgi:hypothetical protein
MDRAIFYAAIPDDGSNETRQLVALFRSEANKLEGSPSARRLGNFVWEVDFRASPVALSILVLACERLEIAYGLLPLDGAPQWILRSPTKTEGHGS